MALQETSKLSQRTLRRGCQLLMAWALASLLAPPPLHAYIDPLSGSLILQVLAAGLFAFVFTMKRSWQWLGGRWQALRRSLRKP